MTLNVKWWFAILRVEDTLVHNGLSHWLRPWLSCIALDKVFVPLSTTFTRSFLNVKELASQLVKLLHVGWRYVILHTLRKFLIIFINTPIEVDLEVFGPIVLAVIDILLRVVLTSAEIILVIATIRLNHIILLVHTGILPTIHARISVGE